MAQRKTYKKNQYALGGIMGAAGGVAGKAGQMAGPASAVTNLIADINPKVIPPEFTATSATYDTSSRSNFAESLSGVDPMKEYSYKDYKKMVGGHKPNPITGAISGASGGAMFGPIGAAAGAVLGIAGGIFGSRKRKKKILKAMKKDNEKIQLLNEFNASGAENTSQNFDTKDRWAMEQNFFAQGGQMDIFGNGFTEFNEGGSHEANPNGGVPVGIDREGNPNLVEEGETKFHDFIFSDRISPTKSELDGASLPTKYAGKSFADISKTLMEEAEERPNDPISQKGATASLDRLRNLQEKVKGEDEGIQEEVPMDEEEAMMQEQQMQDPAAMGMEQGDGSAMPPLPDMNMQGEMMPEENIFWGGGKVANAYGMPSYDPSYDPYSAASANMFEAPASSSSGWKTGADLYGGAGATGAATGGKKDTWTEMLSAAPIFGSLIGTADSMLNPIKANTSALDGIPQRTSGRVSPELLTQRRRFNPLDTNYLNSRLDADSAASRRGLLSLSGGNRSIAAANMMAQDQQVSRARGDMLRQAQEYNTRDEADVLGFNRDTDSANAQAIMRASEINAQRDAQDADRMLRIGMAKQGIRDQTAAANRDSKSQNMSNLFTQLGQLGKFKQGMNAINSNPSSVYGIGADGTLSKK